MATTFADLTGNGVASRAFSFPSIKEADIKVEVDGVTYENRGITGASSGTTTFTITSYTTTGGGNVVFDSAPASPASIRIYRDTDVDSVRATFTAGSSIKAGELNNNMTQVLYAAQEEQNQTIIASDIKDGIITSAKITDGTIVNADVNASAAIAGTKIAPNFGSQNVQTTGDISSGNLGASGNITVTGTVDGRDIAADGIKLDGIETAATADQTASEIKTLLQSDKLTSSEIADNAVNSQHYVDGSIDHVHLGNDIIDGDNIQDDVINSEHYVAGSIDEEHIANSAVTSNKIADNAVTTTEILNGAVTRAKLEGDAIDGTKLADNAVDSEHYTDGSIDTAHIGANQVTDAKLASNSVTTSKILNNAVTTAKIADLNVTRGKLANDAVNEDKLADLAVRTEHIADDAVTAAKIADSVIVTNSEQASASVNDTSFFTTSASDARYFNISSGDTIKNGDTFPDNDTTIATTAAINDRIIDLVDDVGGFVPIANETSFPTSNPDINNPATGGTIVSVSAASTNLAPSGTTVTIANGRGSGLAVVITGVTATIPSGFGFLVETTSTDHTYAFHRLVPKATEVTTVAGKATEIGRLGTADAVADMAILGTADVVSDLNTLGTADVVSDMNTLAVSDVIADMNTLAVTSVVNNMDTVATNVTNVNNVGGSISNVNTTAGSISNVNTVAGSIANVNTTAGSISNVNTTAGSISNVNSVASNMANVNNFADRYQIASNNPSTDGGGNALAAGDLYFNTSANELKVYNGSAWQGGVTASGSFASTTGNTFTGDNRYNDGVKALFGTGSDLEIYHTGSGSVINDVGTGHLHLRRNGSNRINVTDNSAQLCYDGTTKLETTSGGISVSGSVAADGLAVGDAELATFGNSADLVISHGGTDSTITNNTGQLKIAGDAIRITNAAVSETQALFTADGAVELYYDNSKKAETTTNGFQVINGKLDIFNTSGGASIRNVSSSGTFFLGNSTHADLALYVQDSTDNSIILQVNTGEKMLECTAGGSTDLYHHGSKKLETTSTGVTVTGGVTSGSGGFTTTSGNVAITADNAELQLGAGFDLKISHSGSENIFRGDNLIVFRNGANNETTAKFVPNNLVELYYDNSKKFETTATGVSVTGGITATGLSTFSASGSALRLNDNSILRLGNDDTDFFLYHDAGSNGYISTGTGKVLRITTDDFRVFGANNSEEIIRGQKDGSVSLYYDNVVKARTNAGSFQVHGDVISEPNVGNQDAGFRGYPEGSAVYTWFRGYSSDGAHNAGMITHSGQILYLDSSNNQGIYVRAHGTGKHYFQTNNTTRMTIDATNIFLPDSQKINFGAGNDLQIYHDGSHSRITNSTGVLSLQCDQINLNNGVNNEAFANFYANGKVNLNYDNSTKLETYSGGVKISSDANLGRLVLADTDGNFCWQLAGYDEISAGSGGRGVFQDATGAVVLDMRGSGTNIHSYNTIKLNAAGTADNLKVTFGAGDDLQIYHTGTNSAIKNLTGRLDIYANTFHISNLANSEDMARFNNNGSVELYYDYSKKLETASYGINLQDQMIQDCTGINSGDQQIRMVVPTGSSGGFRVLTHYQDGNLAFSGSIANFYTTGIEFTVDVSAARDINPYANNSYDLGTSSYRWRNIYTNDLNLSNEGSSNDIDNTWGNWTIQEGESDLFLKNNRSGKKYKFNLTEVS